MTIPLAFVQRVSDHLHSTLKFEKSDSVRCGQIYKSADRSATVTLYITTGSIHVQGPNHSEMTDSKIFIDDTTLKQDVRPDSARVSMPFSEETDLKSVMDTELDLSSTLILNDSDTTQCIEILKKQTEKQNEFATILTARLEEFENPRTATTSRPSQTVDASTQTDSEGVAVTGTQTDLGMTDSRLRTAESHAQADLSVSHSHHPVPVRHGQEAAEADVWTTDRPGTRSGPADRQGSVNQRPDQSPPRPGPTYAEVVKRQNFNDKYASRYLRNSKTLTDSVKPTATTGSTLIIGSSLVRDIRRRGLAPDVEVNTRRGARISDIRTELESRKLDRYSNIIIQAGGNDVDGKRDFEAIENDYAEIILDIHRRKPDTNFYIAEILPRRARNMTDINKILGRMCELYGATIIPTTQTFPEVNVQQFLKDKLHLSDRGT